MCCDIPESRKVGIRDISDRSDPLTRSATSAGIAFTISDLEAACSLMRIALATDDAPLALRTYKHAIRTLEETHELVQRMTPTAEQQARLSAEIAVLEAQLRDFRAQRR